jgi:hypothetical protein
VTQQHYGIDWSFHTKEPSIVSTEILKETAKQVTVNRAPASRHRAVLHPEEVTRSAAQAVEKEIACESRRIETLRTEMEQCEARLAKLRRLKP